MPQSQKILPFPVRKSCRQRAKDKENLNHKDSAAVDKTKVCTRTLRSSDKKIENNASDSDDFSSLSSAATKCLSPRKLNILLESTPKKGVGSPSKRRSATNLVPNHSPSKIKAGDDNSVENVQSSPKAGCQVAGSPKKSARKKLSMLTPVSPPANAKTPVKSYNSGVTDLENCNRRSPRKCKTLSPFKTPTSSLRPEQLSSKKLFSSAKKSLNTQQPDRLVCRESEIAQIMKFIDARAGPRCAGSLYISGAPGTGKTAVVKHIMAQHYQDVIKIFINSMTLKSPLALYKAIAEQLIGEQSLSLKNAKTATKLLREQLTCEEGSMVLLVIDEIDQLDSRYQEVLYTIFEWPTLPASRLILIGIANALDLTDRILPRLHTKSNCKPQLLNFTPYTKDQIVAVIESRLSETPKASEVLDKSAVTFCARKVSAVSGDMRKALDICRRSLDLTEMSHRKHQLLKMKNGNLESSDSTTTFSPKVSLMQVVNVVDEAYGVTSQISKTDTFPLQQKLIVCTLLVMLKHSKLKEFILGKVHDTYSRICKKCDVTATDQSEFLALCQLLETRGLMELKKGKKEIRLGKIHLRVDSKELEFILKDQPLFSSILDSRL